jgi:hypothetical protein
MAKARKPKFRVGMTVVVRSARRRARIVHMWPVGDGSMAVNLDRKVDGFNSWNTDALRPLTAREIGPRSPSASKEE